MQLTPLSINPATEKYKFTAVRAELLSKLRFSLPTIILSLGHNGQGIFMNEVVRRFIDDFITAVPSNHSNPV